MKASEIREMSIADLRERIELEKANLETMKINHTISPLEDTHFLSSTVICDHLFFYSKREGHV